MEWEYVAFVSGACESLLLKAVLTHLVGDYVMLKLCADNTSAVAIAAKEGVSKIKHLSGKLLWVQQPRQGLQAAEAGHNHKPIRCGNKVLLWQESQTSLVLHVLRQRLWKPWIGRILGGEGEERKERSTEEHQGCHSS